REAERTGARLIHAAGFDSIPHDLGAYFTVLQLPEDVPLHVSGYVRASAMFSGGTFHSALTAFSRPRQNLAAARDRKALEPEATDSRLVHAAAGRPHRDPVEDGWAVPMPTIDPQIVSRSARAVPRYGPDFTYSHFASIPHLYTAVGGVAGVGALFGLAQIPPARRALLNRVKAGEGPSAAKRARSWFTVTFVGEGGGERVVTRVSGGDPGYDETAKMLAESALSLALDDLPTTAGQVTTAQALGDALIDRLRKAGMGFEVLA
ncbi:MAG: saccharopine dehydrogenase, partial [Actinomycetota bacterium]|nr:saccharopine dehydrogenase [Actinomycetota bacterium]